MRPAWADACAYRAGPASTATGTVGPVSSPTTFDTVVVNGSVGTGKTTTADRLGDLLRGAGVPGAVIDVDWLRRSWPAPADDPFRAGQALENLRALASTFRRDGAEVLVVAGVVEDVLELGRYRTATSATGLLHVRLSADPEVVAARLRRRHGDDAPTLRWHLERHPELARTLDAVGFADEMRLDTTNRTPAEVAQQVLEVVLGGAVGRPRDRERPPSGNGR